jgi:hypothetical protein
MQPPIAVPAVDPRVFTFLDVVTLSMGLASIVLAVVAIYISIAFKNQSDRVAERTTDLLIDVRSDARAVSGVVMRELAETGDWWRRNVPVAHNRIEGTAMVAPPPGPGVPVAPGMDVRL